jgi:DNA polymerase-3 subunit epsilon
MGNYSVVVRDFETTGLSPNCGDRAIEIGAVLIWSTI